MKKLATVSFFYGHCPMKWGVPVPRRGMLAVVSGHPECLVQSFLFERGFGPARRGPFVSAKGPKTIPARAWPCGSPSSQHRITWLRNSLRSDSPRRVGGFGAATQPRARRNIQTQKRGQIFLHRIQFFTVMLEGVGGHPESLSPQDLDSRFHTYASQHYDA